MSFRLLKLSLSVRSMRPPLSRREERVSYVAAFMQKIQVEKSVGHGAHSLGRLQKLTQIAIRKVFQTLYKQKQYDMCMGSQGIIR